MIRGSEIKADKSWGSADFAVACAAHPCRDAPRGVAPSQGDWPRCPCVPWCTRTSSVSSVSVVFEWQVFREIRQVRVLGVWAGALRGRRGASARCLAPHDRGPRHYPPHVNFILLIVSSPSLGHFMVTM